MTHQTNLFATEQTTISTDDHYTPKWVFDALGLVFDIDVASPPQGPPFVPCRQYFTMADDGLAQPWDGLIWMNPPFSNQKPWINRFIEHNNGVALLPMARSYHNVAIFEHPQTKVMLLHDPGKDRIWFHYGKKKKGINYPIFLYAMGDTAQQALIKSNLGYVR